MARYYTVDRARKLRPGYVIGYEIDCKPILPDVRFRQEDLERLARDLFPEGLTRHGAEYLLRLPFLVASDFGPGIGEKISVLYEPFLEMVLEIVRVAWFADKPSRFSSVFAWQTLDEAKAFRDKYNGGDIYMVDADPGFQADMKLVALGGTNIAALWLARQYWRGEASATPAWETLLRPPVVVGEKVG